jgi:CheY-like chemotaxis protein
MSGYGILIVDDDSFQRKILDEYLGLAGFKILHARNGAHALKVIEQERPELILMDIQMPVMDGFETLTAIKKKPQLRDIPVIFLSSLDLQHLKIKGLELGADDYITKPFNSAELLARIKAVLRRTERYRRTEGIMEGDLSDIGLVELLQSMEMGLKTATIRLAEMDGHIYISNGSLVDASQGSFKGEKAITRIFFLEKGSFSVDFDRKPNTIFNSESKPIMSVLMKVLSYVDDVNDIMKHIRGADRPLKINTDMADFPVFEKFINRPPLSLPELMVSMEGDLKDNLKMIILALKKGKLKAVN